MIHHSKGTCIFQSLTPVTKYVLYPVSRVWSRREIDKGCWLANRVLKEEVWVWRYDTKQGCSSEIGKGSGCNQTKERHVTRRQATTPNVWCETGGGDDIHT